MSDKQPQPLQIAMDELSLMKLARAYCEDEFTDEEGERDMHFHHKLGLLTDFIGHVFVGVEVHLNKPPQN